MTRAASQLGDQFHVVPQVDAVGDGLWAVRVPLHVRVEPVNAYVGERPDGGLVVFDTGIAFGAEQLWKGVLDSLGRTQADIAQVIVSHHHPDHIGGSRAMHELTGLPVHASASTVEQAPGVWGDGGRLEQYFAEMEEHYRRHGVPKAAIAALGDDLLLARTGVELAPDDAWIALAPGTELEFAGTRWVVHDMPGHADGHLVLHDPSGSRLLSADHLLERISPAVGQFPRHAEDPLGNYIRSLHAAADLDPAIVLPGHGLPFSGGADRARALVQHHALRVESCVEAVNRGASEEHPAGVTAYDAARRAFERVFSRARVSMSDERFATTETLAHLEHARLAGRVERREHDDGTVRYRPA